MGTGTEAANSVPLRSQSPFPRTIEAFLLVASGDLYDRDMVLGFVRRLRDQRRFDGPEALTAQMAKDVEEVRRIVE
jgi:riboflavin kinase / FMN adenylyltransferase